MNCHEISDRLSEYFDGELSSDLALQVREHVQNCKKCSAELRSFEKLSQLVASSEVSVPSNGSWDRIAAVLDQSTRTPNSQRWIGSYGRLAAGVGLAIAASLVLVITNWVPQESNNNHSYVQAGVAVDFQEIIKDYLKQPVSTFESLAKKFEGREASSDVAEALLGYKPSIARALPDGVQLVSTKVLKLPYCHCAAGQCTCGPDGCNCSVSLCKREDGSNLLIVESCQSQSISFGNLASQSRKLENQEFQVLPAGDQLAVTGIFGKRRLIAIGLTDSKEAETLVSRASRSVSMN